MARIEFKPPSDFVADDGGGGKKSSIWKWLGIGCGVIALIIGGLLAAGAWKTVSCCSEAVDSARKTGEARQFSIGYAQELAQGDVESARAKMTEELKSKISAEQLRDRLSEHQRFFESSPPRLSNFMVNKTSTDAPMIWEMTVEFAPPTAHEKLVVLTELVSRGEGETQTFLVDDLRFEERSRDIASEPPAVEVLDFHRQLRGGSYEQAYRHMSSDFTQQSNLEAFRSFVREQKEVFRTGEVDIDSVAYSGDGRALVVAQARSKRGEEVRIEYELVRPNQAIPKWLISSVTPTYDAAPPSQKEQGTPDAGGAQEGQQDASAGTDEPADEEAADQN